MSYFEFDDGLSKFKKNRRKNKKSPYHTPTSTGAGIGTAYNIHNSSQNTSSTSMNSNGCDDETNDGSVSFTYSASSSQAGESTDSSSIADVGVMLQLEKEHQHHIMQQQHAQRMRGQSGHGLQQQYGNLNSQGSHTQGRNFNREKSGVDSLGYSDDEDNESVYQTNWTTISGQPSNSYAHDGGSSSYSKSGPSPKSITHKKNGSATSPVSIAADLNSCAGSGSVSASGGSGSASTPNTPPPRHSARKMMMGDNTEVWYQKWWMCGFTDALNLNPNSKSC